MVVSELAKSIVCLFLNPSKPESSSFRKIETLSPGSKNIILLSQYLLVYAKFLVCFMELHFPLNCLISQYYINLTHEYCVCSPADEFKGHSLLQAAREADLAKVKKTLALEVINFKQPQSHETALVRLQSCSVCFRWLPKFHVHNCS